MGFVRFWPNAEVRKFFPECLQPTRSGHSWRGRELQISDRKPVVQLRRIATLLIARRRRISL